MLNFTHRWFLSWRDEGFCCGFWWMKFPISHLKSQGCPCCLFSFSWILWGFPCFSWLLFDLFASFLLVFPCVSSLVLASCFLLLFGFFRVLNGVSGTRLLINWALNLWQSGLNRTETWFFTEFSPFFLVFGWVSCLEIHPKRPASTSVAAPSPGSPRAARRRWPLGPPSTWGWWWPMEKWGDLMGFSC